MAWPWNWKQPWNPIVEGLATRRWERGLLTNDYDSFLCTFLSPPPRLWVIKLANVLHEFCDRGIPIQDYLLELMKRREWPHWGKIYWMSGSFHQFRHICQGIVSAVLAIFPKWNLWGIYWFGLACWDFVMLTPSRRRENLLFHNFIIFLKHVISLSLG